MPAPGQRHDYWPVVEYAAARLLRDGPAEAAVGEVLTETIRSFGGRAALMLQSPAPGKLTVVAAAPPAAAADPALLSALRTLAERDDGLLATGGTSQSMLSPSGRTGRTKISALLAAPEPVPGQPPCFLVLTGTATWRPDAASAARSIAAVLAAQLRHASEASQLAGLRAASEARFRQLAEFAPVGIVETDSSGMVVFANERWCTLTGLPALDAIGGSWTRAVHPDDIERVSGERARAFADGTEMRIDCRLRPSGRDDVWVHAAVTALAGPDGQVTGGLAALTNISGRKREERERARLLRAEQEARRGLADQTQRLQSLIAAAIPGVLFTDEHGHITELNQSFCDLFGLREGPAELAGTSVAELVRRIKKTFVDPAEFVRRTGEAFVRRQPASGERMTCTDGRTLECDYWPVLADGDYRGDLWLAWDMSERTELERQRERTIEAELAARELAEQAQQQLAEQNASLQAADAEKTQYLAMASHELGTPLTSIVSFVELIRQDGSDPGGEVGAFLDIIERNAEHLRHMVGELSLLSRIEAGLLPLELRPVVLPALLAEEATSVSAVAAAGGVTITIDGADDGPPVQADEHRLRQVLDNLIANAVKFSDGGEVRVVARLEGDWWRIEITDSGIGIPPEELDTIFDRFSRGSNAKLAGLPGTGLGLSIVKAVTELHGGRVEAQSAIGGPTTFRLWLPAETG